MSKNNAVVPQPREALDKFKMEAASDVDVQFPLKQKHAKTIHFMAYIFNITYPKAAFSAEKAAFLLKWRAFMVSEHKESFIHLSVSNINPFTGHLHENFECMINDTIYQIATSCSTVRKICID